MGVDYKTILAVGKVFDDDHDVRVFLESAGLEITEEEEELIEEDGIVEWLYGQEKWPDLECEIINYYNDYGRVLGYRIALAPYETFAERIKVAQSRFKAVFDVEGEVINRVCVY